MLLAGVERVLARYGVGRSGEEVVLVACSGGRDSVVLAHAAAQLLGARRVVLAHVDHAARPDSGMDAAHVAELAVTLGTPHRARRLENVPRHPSEADLREWRYGALESMRVETGADWILTAHTADDQAETVLLAWLRSARLETLRGMPIRRGKIMRPMLRVPRHAVRAYAEENGLIFRDDPSNVEPRYLRNRIRKELLPLIETRYRARAAVRFVRFARGLTRVLARPAGLGAGRGNFVKKCNEKKAASHIQPVVPAIAFEKRAWTGVPVAAFPDGEMVAMFDAGAFRHPVLRATRAGDRIQPFGMTGRRKVRDLLREHGVPVEARATYPVVTDPDGRVLWVPGASRSSAYPVGPLTQEVWVFWMSDGDKLRAAAEQVTVEKSR